MPKVSITGKAGAILQKEEPYFDPSEGWQNQQTWIGVKLSIQAKAAEMAAAGLKVRVSQDGPKWSLVCSIPEVTGGQGGGQDVLDQYELDAEWAQDSIYVNPKVLEAAGNNPLNVAKWRKLIEAALKKDPPEGMTAYGLPATPESVAMQDALYNLVALKVEAFETRRYVLRRRRTIAASYAGPVELDPLEKVYSTDSLIATFELPALIANQLPDDPVFTPVGTVWAWKARTDASHFIPAINKKEEVKEWVFAAWTLLLYTHA